MQLSQQWYTIDRIGRRKLWITMGFGQMIVLIFEAACVAVNNTSSNIAAVFFIFLYETCFTWGPYSNRLKVRRLLT